MHLLEPYFDYFLGDGSHGFSKYGWKWIPICIMTSCGVVVPIGSIWGLEEDTESLQHLLRLFRQHCMNKGCSPAAFQIRVSRDAALSSGVQVLDLDGHQWATENLRTHVYPPEMEKFLVALLRDNASDEQLIALAIFVTCPDPTLHCDSGPALIKLSQLVRWSRTACAKHAESNIPSCKPEFKEQVMSLLYDKNMSLTMAYNVRDNLLSGVLQCAALGKPSRDWMQKSFGTDEAMAVSASYCSIREITSTQINTQAFRNFIVTCGYQADSLMEVTFRNKKGFSEDRYSHSCLMSDF